MRLAVQTLYTFASDLRLRDPASASYRTGPTAVTLLFAQCSLLGILFVLALRGLPPSAVLLPRLAVRDGHHAVVDGPR